MGIYKPQHGLLRPAAEKERETEAEDPGRHMPSKLLASNAPYPILLHFALRSIYCYTVISEITQISGASQPITQPPEQQPPLPVARAAGKQGCCFPSTPHGGHAAVIATWPPSPGTDIRGWILQEFDLRKPS